jgi:ABC-type transport system involved in multi-copper enzyme maturation permease subunit
MNVLPSLPWLVRDTFRQSRAAGIFWLMLGITGLCALLCLTLSVTEGGEPGAPVSHVRLGLGLIQYDAPGGRADAVRALLAHLAGAVAGSAGLLLVLLWTAALLPSFLEPSALTVLLVKPVPRWGLLAGKCLGVFAFVAFQAGAFVGTTWLALGARSGAWDLGYLLCVPVLLAHFAVFFSFSAMLAVATRNAVVCVLGSLLFWLVCTAMNFGRHAVASVPDLSALPGGLGRGIEFGYWVLPKPLDFHILMMQAQDRGPGFGRLIHVPTLIERGAWSPEWAVASSLLCAAVLLAVTAYDFVTAEY